VHSHDYKTDLLALLLSYRAGVIPLSTSHGWTGQNARERFVYYPVGKRLLSRFPRVIAVSTDIKEHLVQRGTRADRVTVLLNAIDSDAFRRDDQRRAVVRAEFGCAPDEIVAGAVGRLEPQKRFDLLLAAFAGLSPRHPGLRLVIAGDGSLRDDLIARANALGIAAQCRFLGHRSDIADLHHAFDLFVQSSEYEGTPNAVLEAMAMETPLVATDVGGTRELAIPGKDALIIPSGDVSRLQSAIEDVLLDPAAARTRAIAARRRVESDLSFETRTRRLEGIYEDLIHDRDAAKAARGAASRVHHA
jgi:glycosyltransferase involved in cell wall biosynthesis